MCERAACSVTGEETKILRTTRSRMEATTSVSVGLTSQNMEYTGNTKLNKNVCAPNTKMHWRCQSGADARYVLDPQKEIKHLYI